MTALTKQQLVKEIERLVQDGMDSRWLKGKAQVKAKIEGGRVTGLDTLTVEQLLDLCSDLEQRQSADV